MTRTRTSGRSEGQTQTPRQSRERGEAPTGRRSDLPRRSFLQWIGATLGIGGAATQTASATQSGGGSAGLSATASGDGTQTSFTVTHDLGRVPTQVVVTAATEDAMADHYVSAVTDRDFTISYAGPPPDGYMNLGWNATLRW